mgnify:CR=1 FL=1
MEITSFDSNDNNNKIKRDTKPDNLFDLFQKNIIYVNSIPLNLYIVPREFEMRLDRISYYIYGSTEYVEELMVINDIISPYSVKQGQYIFFCNINDIGRLYTSDKLMTELQNKKKELINSTKPSKNMRSNNNLPPTIKSNNLKQIKVTKDNKVKIINKFE